MKNSEMYKLAQIAVMHSAEIMPEVKLDILRILMADESLALYGEEKEAQKAAVEE